MSYNKYDFVTAYTYSYGSTKKEALQVWKTTDTKYHNAIIEGFKNDARSAFYND